MVAATGDRWGEWLFDDLAFVAKQVTRLVGPSEVVTQLRVLRPDHAREEIAPTVVIVVPDASIAHRMRDRLVHGEYVVDVYEPLFGDSWQAEVNGLVIRIETEAA